MTRQQFLNSEWQKYPLFSAAAPPSEDTWISGRLQSVSTGGDQIEINGESYAIGSSKTMVAGLGTPAPLAALKAGDVVAFNVEKQAVYLLSPCLTDEATPARVEWQMFLHVVHDYFAQKGFIHWLTPSFVESSGVDANIDFFIAQGVRTGRQYRLPTSPEFELKKAMIEGVEMLYEIKNCFRDDDPTPVHKSEFAMLEWYRSFATIEEIEQDVVELVNTLIEGFALPYEPFESFPRYSISDLFDNFLSYEFTPQITSDDLRALLEREKLGWSPSDDWNDLFFRIYVDRIEPKLAALGPIVVNGFPAQQRSLSRLTSEGWADRFEFYWNGIEIANAYHEENNPETIVSIVQSEMAKRVKAGKTPITQDTSFLEMMKRGFPPSAGIALGLDRLYISLKGQRSF